MVINEVNVLGNVGSDPIVRATKTGRFVASFSVACNRTFTTPQGEQKEATDWINVVVWGELANQVGSHVNKGRKVFVRGRLSTRSYEDQNGMKKYVTEVVADTVALALPTYAQQNGGGFGGGYSSGAGGSGNFGQFGQQSKKEDIPF